MRLIYFFIHYIFYFFLGFTSPVCFTQTIIEGLSSESLQKQSFQLPQEVVKKVSNTKQIFIISNENKSHSQGDFITILQNNELIARAIVAKTTNNSSGIKIIKVYSVKRWQNLAIGNTIEVLKGDDSYYITAKFAPPPAPAETDNTDDITIEDDLYDTTGLDDDVEEQNNDKTIKTDNIAGVSLGAIGTLDAEGSSRRDSHWNFQWAYQITDNIWIEGLYGQSVINDFPNKGLSTTLSNFTVRGKYTFLAPFYSYIQPYFGVQVLDASSPDAGQQDASGSLDTSVLAREQELVQELKKNTVIFGVTILKRLVPGWFLRADLGTDILNAGVSLEF